jgi:hypothetical protein
LQPFFSEPAAKKILLIFPLRTVRPTEI